MVACTTLGLKTSTVSGEANTASIPNQSAMRRMVPRFPGSRMPSSARKRPDEGSLADERSSGLRTSASTGEGEESALIRAMAASPISSFRYTFSTLKPDLNASWTNFSPSTTKSPRSSRNFFWDKDLMNFISAAVILIYTLPNHLYPKVLSMDSADCSSAKMLVTRLPSLSRSMRMCLGEGMRQCLMPP